MSSRRVEIPTKSSWPDLELTQGENDLALMLTPAQAAVIARATVRDINRRVEAGVVHFMETPEGLLLVCIYSLS